MATFRNTSRRPVTFQVTHPDAPKTDVTFVQSVHDPQSGDVSHRGIDRRVPESITLLGGEERELPDYVTQEAIRAGLQRVKKEEPKPEQKSGEKDDPQYALKQRKGRT